MSVRTKLMCLSVGFALSGPAPAFGQADNLDGIHFAHRASAQEKKRGQMDVIDSILKYCLPMQLPVWPTCEIYDRFAELSPSQPLNMLAASVTAAIPPGDVDNCLTYYDSVVFKNRLSAVYTVEGDIKANVRYLPKIMDPQKHRKLLEVKYGLPGGTNVYLFVNGVQSVVPQQFKAQLTGNAMIQIAIMTHDHHVMPHQQRLPSVQR